MALYARCRRLGLSPVFITDHGSIKGAELMRARYPEEIVAGQEVTTTEGDLIGLFLKQRLPSGMTPEDTIAMIKAQDGLVYLEHPYDTRRRCLTESAIERIATDIDIVEVFNGRATDESNRKAQDLCLTIGAAAGAGSDAHTISEIGTVYVELAPFAGSRDFLVKLRSGRIVHPNRWVLAARSLL